MKLKSAIALFVFTLVGFISIADKKHNELDKFKWMDGNWKMSTKRGTIIEFWKTMNDSTKQGESRFIKNEMDTTLLETISLVYRKQEYFYIPVAKGQNNNDAVPFTITTFSENGFVAENPEHDFPKRITYQLVNQDSIHAYIDGGPSMPEKKSNFYYSRIKN